MLSMPQLANVTPLVPPTMMMSAEMLMNEAGLVPSIVALMSSATVAATIPMPVAAFMSLGSASGSDTSAAGSDTGAFDGAGARVRQPHRQRHGLRPAQEH